MVPTFRLNPLVDLVAWSALDAHEREHLRRLTGRSEIPGVVRPKERGTATVKAIDEATMALLESFRTPVPWPACESIASIPPFLERFVLDEVLQLEVDGRFVGGPAAMDALGTIESPAVPDNRIAALSIDALRYAASLPIADPRVLSARLYTFNAVPRSPKWETIFGEAARIAELLGIGPSGPSSAALESAGYMLVQHAHWFGWAPASAIRNGVLPELPFKVYISSRPECIADVFGSVVHAVIAQGVGSLKVGRTTQNLLRADKLIAYVDSESSMRALADALEPIGRRFPAQGVPFTCGLDESGMLSWGSDPPRSLAFAGWAQAESWRACIADYLALGLIQARAHACAEPWRFALRKAALEGIDTARWAPART